MISLCIYFLIFILFDIIYYSNIYFLDLNNFILNFEFNLLNNYLMLYNIGVAFICLIFFFIKTNKNYKINFSIFFFTIICVYFLLLNNNVYYFFFFYEILMIPSIILIYYSSPSLRSKIITMYFIL